MTHLQRLEDARVTRPTTLTIGSFDGVHRGHQFLLAQLVADARAAGHTPAVLTFHPHPRLVLKGWEPGCCLTGPERRAELLQRHGVELVVTYPFDDAVRHMRAREFVERLKRYLNLAELWVGPDFALGYRREGDVPMLRALGAELGYRLRVIEEKLSIGGEAVSSGRIRAALRAGQVELASELLGRPYAVEGTVVRGDGRGRQIGIPTANLQPPVDRLIPARGVYSTWALIPGGVRVASVTNVGVRPTFAGEPHTTVEAHLLDFAGELYDPPLTLEFVTRLRDERRFAGVDELVAQIRHDVEAGRQILKP